MQKDITIGEKKFVVRELLAREVDDIDFKDSKNALKKQVILSTGINEIEYENLTLRERLGIFKVINEINGLGDFQVPK